MIGYAGRRIADANPTIDATTRIRSWIGFLLSGGSPPSIFASPGAFLRRRYGCRWMFVSVELKTHFILGGEVPNSSTVTRASVSLLL